MAEMTTLELVTEFASRQGLPRPSSVVAATDDTTQQILGLLNEGAMDLADRFQFQQLRNKITFQHIGGTDYTALDLAVSYPDFKYLVPDTLWDETGRLAVAGPLTAAEWRQTTIMLGAPARYSFRLYGGKLHIYPAPDPLASITFGMEYGTRYAVFNPVAMASTETYTLDTSYPKLPSNVILADLKWRWRQAKGLPYAEDQRISEEMIANLQGRDDQGVLHMDDTQLYANVGPGLLVPAGSWNLP